MITDDREWWAECFDHRTQFESTSRLSSPIQLLSVWWDISYVRQVFVVVFSCVSTSLKFFNSNLNFNILVQNPNESKLKLHFSRSSDFSSFASYVISTVTPLCLVQFLSKNKNGHKKRVDIYFSSKQTQQLCHFWQKSNQTISSSYMLRRPQKYDQISKLSNVK